MKTTRDYFADTELNNTEHKWWDEMQLLFMFCIVSFNLKDKVVSASELIYEGY